jgi:tetratricopeptide (TPR) repeat protein
MKLHRPGFLAKPGALLAAGLLLFCTAALALPPGVSAPSKRKTAATPVPKSAATPKAEVKKSVSSTPSPVRRVLPSTPEPEASDPLAEGEFADAHPGNNAAAPDLALHEQGARKAEALAWWAQATLAGDAAETDVEIAGYRRTLALDPGFTELAVKLAFELTRRNDVPGAIQVLKDTAKAAPKEPLPLIYLSQLYAKQLKKFDFALKYAEQALALAPDDFQAHNALYELHTSAGQPKKAEEALARAAQARSTDPKFWLQLGDLHTRLYLRDDGNAEPEPLARMNLLYRKAAELGKGDALTLAKVGDYFVLSRQVKEAIPFYLEALALRPTEDDPAIVNLREKLARAYLVTDQRDTAIATLEAVVREQPLRFETYELLGELYQQKGDTEKALQNYEQTLRLDSSQPDNYLRLAEIFLRMKRPEKAVETMRAAREKFPDLPQVAYSYAVTLSQAKQHTAALAAFAEARAEAERSHAELLTGAFFFQYGAAAEQAGKIEQAAELLRESIRLDPANAAQAQNYLGYMWVDRDVNVDEGGELIKKALEVEPDNAAYLDSLGWYYYKKGRYEDALKELTKALESLKEEDPVVFDHLGDTYQKLGKPADAMNFWQKSLALEDDPKVREKLEAAKQKITLTAPPAK